MSIGLSILAAGILQTAPGPLPAQGWVWSLYDNSSSVVVLAEEVPDTPHLRATFECARETGQIKLVHYQAGEAVTGTASVSAGTVEQDLPVTVEGHRLTLSLRAASPLFQSLLATQSLSVEQEDQAVDIRFDRNSLRRFAEACAG
jgi:hypothetical protein